MPCASHHGLRQALHSCVLFVLAGCALETDGAITNAPYDDDPVAVVTAELTTVPSSVRCIRITVTNGTSVTRTFDVIGGSSTAALDVGRLALGPTSFAPSAFNVVCSSVTASTVPDWVGPAVTAEVRTGINPAVRVTLVQNVSTTIGVDFKQPVVNLIAAGNNTYAVLPTGAVSSWGAGESGLLGNGASSSSRTTPATATLLTSISTLSASSFDEHACAVTSAGALRCWGSNAQGQLGDGTTTTRLSPVTATGMASGVASVSVGNDFACALRSDKSIVCSGTDASGQLGNGTGGSSNTFQPIGVGFQFTQVAAADQAACGITTFADVMCWGASAVAGGSSPRHSPTWINSFFGVVELAAGEAHMCALKADGTVWCWGSNNAGQLGDGSNLARSSPVQALGITSAVQIASAGSSSCARLEDGTVKCWGDATSLSTHGAVGDGSGMRQLSPVTVRNVTDAISISAGRAHACARLASGELKCWGNNQYGQLGDGTTTFRAAPVNVLW